MRAENRPQDPGTLSPRKPQEILPKATVDCRKHEGRCQPEEELAEIMSRISNGKREQHVHGGERRHQTRARLHENDAERCKVLLLEALLKPVHHLDVIDDLLHKTLQDLVLGENHEDFHGDAAASHTQKSTPGLLGESNVDRNIFCTGSWCQ